MLTADHVEARIKDGELVLRRFDARSRAEAEALAAAYLDDARAHVGRTREELEEAWEGHDAGARAKLAAGLRKLVEDRCRWAEELGVDPIALRRDLFRRACEQRRARGSLDRAGAIAETAAAMGIDAARVDAMLFADRRGEDVLREAPTASARTIVNAYEIGRTQAVLLRAVRVTCEVSATAPALLRALFAKLKFHQLLFTVERSGPESYRIVVDGPFSMFESVTRYGLKLALIVPALRELEAWKLHAEIRWGKARTPVVFREEPRAATPASDRGPSEGEGVGDGDDEVRRIITAIAASGSGWTAEPAAEILSTASGRVVVPDLVVSRGDARVYVELLGFWSRDAVWRRIEMAAEGLGASPGAPRSAPPRSSTVFCANARLRVSEDVLTEDAHAALYVYKSRISARALLDRVERVAYPASPCTSSSPEHPAASEKPSPAST